MRGALADLWGPRGERSGSFPGVFTCENSQLAFKRRSETFLALLKERFLRYEAKKFCFPPPRGSSPIFVSSKNFTKLFSIRSTLPETTIASLLSSRILRYGIN
ncbi:hypothetical protein CEXT_552351 [Caerostris extrusa]|uniref:Maturase K n=1 Tax=Caerostris extrusa TaxID=172846 RepID=A0AAV4NT80_CAEEX|nr:hypothetical protein CEXT_552351 [Caerostris extrusa]